MSWDELQTLFKAARSRWLKTTEVLTLFELCETFKIPLNHQAPTTPHSGMLYCFDKVDVKHFRRDEHEWKTRAKSSAVQEHHEKLKIEGAPVINCTYVRHKNIPTFHRRVYQRLAPDGQTTNADSTVIVHYLDTAATPQQQNAVARRVDDPSNPPMNHPEIMKARETSRSGSGRNGVGTGSSGSRGPRNGVPIANADPGVSIPGGLSPAAPRDILSSNLNGSAGYNDHHHLRGNGGHDMVVMGAINGAMGGVTVPDPGADFLFAPDDPPVVEAPRIDVPMDTSGDDMFQSFLPDMHTLSPLEHQLFNAFPSIASQSSPLGGDGKAAASSSQVKPVETVKAAPSAATSRRKSTGSTGSSRASSSTNGVRKNTHSGVVSTKAGKSSVGKVKNKSSLSNKPGSPKHSSRSSHILVTVSDVCPSWDTTAGGSKVLITSPHVTLGHNYSVAFGSTEVPAETVMSGVIRCFAPAHSVGTVSLRIKSSSSNIVQVNDVNFEFRASDNDDSLTALFQSLSDHEFQARLLDRVERLERAVSCLPNLPNALGAIDFSANADRELHEAYRLSERNKVVTVPTVSAASPKAIRRLSSSERGHDRRLSLKEQTELPKRLSALIVTALDRAHNSHPVLVDLVLNTKDSRGLSMAHILAALGDSYCIAMRACVGFGLKLGLTDVNGHTPLDWAKARFHHAMEGVVRTGLGQPMAARAITKLQQLFRNRKKKKVAAAKIITAFRRHKLKSQAAARIQNLFRSHRKHRAATKIQAVFKGHRVRGVEKPGVTYTEKWRAASLIQNAYRNHQVLDRNTGDLELLTINSVLSDGSLPSIHSFADDVVSHASSMGADGADEDDNMDIDIA